MAKKIEITAPAKVNLFLHVIGKRLDGYHLLQSINAFTDFGDDIIIEPSNHYNLEIEGEFSVANDQNNLVTRAVHALSDAISIPPDVSIHLRKNIPYGAGLGGGSSDAATVIKALLNLWDTTITKNQLDKILLCLGADVPACYQAKACLMEGVGEIVRPIENFAPLHAVLVYPRHVSPTHNIFQDFSQNFSDEITNIGHDVEFLKNQKNDLTAAAVKNMPLIDEVKKIIRDQKQCIFSRMTGSGSACFGIFENQQSAVKAAQIIKIKHPDWWVKSCILS